VPIVRNQQKKWVIKPLPDGQLVASVMQMLNVSLPIAQLLVQRGYFDFGEAKNFFRPHLSELHDPFLMADMEKAKERLVTALKNQEKILIYGDYDVDGTTAVAVFYGLLSKYFSNLEYYISDRYQEGYGISERGIEYAETNGFTLIISLDCGIKSHDKVALAKQKGIDFIICDHHTPGQTLPQAVAVLDPKRQDCPYPFKELTGCGVGFKLLQAILPELHIDSGQLYSKLDLMVVSIACDLVPIVGENRIFAKAGLDILNKNPNPALKALIKMASLPAGNIKISDIVFGIGPRINAAGRISHANQAVELLLSKTDETAWEAAKHIDTKNTIRKGYDADITEEALSMIEAEGYSDMKTTVLYKASWHKGVVGIVASRCVEHYYRPTIILTESNGKASGSARSVDGYDIHQAILGCAELLDHFGGHKYAAGVTLPIENIDLFRHKFEEIVSQTITEEQLTPKIDIDLLLSFDDINDKMYDVLMQFAPFGPENMQPVFASEQVVSVGEIKILKEKHLKMLLKQVGGVRSIEAIGFNMIDFYPIIIGKKPFKICYTLDVNDFRGEKTLQIVLKDVRPSNDIS